jgi:hypothetical protein
MTMMVTTMMLSLDCRIRRSMTFLVVAVAVAVLTYCQCGDAFQSNAPTAANQLAKHSRIRIQSLTQTWAVVSSTSRRTWMSDMIQKSKVVAITTFTTTTAAVGPWTIDSKIASAEVPSSSSYDGDEQQQFDPDDPEFEDVYNNPAIPPAPEERSGLVVLRVAEVAQFQEKILRAIVDGSLQGVMVSPMQFAFGTQILLRNSNLDGNMKLMIDTEIPKQDRPKAIKNAVNAMNELQEIAKYSASLQRDFEPLEMVTLADMYQSVRINLNQLYEYLPAKEQVKYDGYMVAVTEYEKKIANGTYNPDIDGVLKFDEK